MFNFKAFAQTAIGRITGHTDILEAYLAGGIGMAAADGRIDREELEQVRASAKADEFVTRLFSEDVIDSTMNKMVQKIKASGMAAIDKELEDIAGEDDPIRHAVYLCIYKTAKADGVLDPAEVKMADKYAGLLNITPADKAGIEDSVDDNEIVFDF
ncbi:tellurite resistance TerB family protein [Roseibium sp. Sym1]|uniref:tellurite resistance TerB family protein n=1 Tax=Roseibium sp. Sym1 TaxID=3016006 RepID=UPI0022B5C563|nr:tellurite resistance TerB family protein [Roseibium sp. Sym1]